MEFILLELANYLILLFTALFALDGCICLILKKEKSRKWCYIRQKVCIFIVQTLCYAVMSFRTRDKMYVLLFGVVQVLLFSILSVTPLIYEYVNRLLLNNMCFLLGIGFIMIGRLSFSKGVRQVIIAGVGFLLALAIPVVIARFELLKNGWILYGILGAAILTGVFVLGEITNGSKISFSLYGITFQPSEFVKIIFIFFIASALFYKVNAFRIIFSAVMAAVYILILVASKDLGAALIFALTYMLMLFIATNSYILLFACMIVGTAGSIAAYHLFPHIQSRVIAWQDPFTYIDGAGYQIAQSLFAISSGGLFGVGLFHGNPKVIPYVEDDMIFSAICEEMGILFGLLLIIICFLSFFQIMKIGMQSREHFHKLLCVGLASAYAIQILLTIGGGIKFIPLTGVTLPFISYGGSSVCATIFVFFIVQGVHVCTAKENKQLIEGIDYDAE